MTKKLGWLMAALVASTPLAQAQIAIDAGSLNIFRDLRSANDAGIPAGDQIQFAFADDGAIVALNGEPPPADASMSIDGSPLCQAPTPSAAPASPK